VSSETITYFLFSTTREAIKNHEFGPTPLSKTAYSAAIID